MSESGDDGPGQREVAYRLFATEYDDADLEYSESDEERAPNYVITPTGGRVNRLFVVGVLTEVEPVSDDVLRGRVVDPTGAFVCYAGQYQPDERAALDRAEPPSFVAVTGKARTFQPEDSDRVFTSVRPESISDVDAAARDRWTVDAAEQTLHRVEAMATGLALDATGEPLRQALVDRGYDEGLAAGVDLALQHYGTTPTYLAAVRDLAIDAARHVAGDLEEVPALEASPDDEGDVTAADLLAEPVEPLAEAEPDTTTEQEATPDEPAEPATDTSEPAETTTEPEAPVEPEPSGGDGPTDAAEAESVEDEPETSAATEDEGPGDFEPGDFDLDEDEREEIEDEYGTEFQSGTEVDEPGEAGIETPDPEEIEVEPEADDAEAAPDSESGAEPAEEEADESDDAVPEDEDLVDAVVSAMEDLDEGDGADHAAVVDTVAESHGVAPDAIEDAIEEALMDGRCYEPDDATLKPI